MTAIDISKIKPGDRVKAEFVVEFAGDEMVYGEFEPRFRSVVLLKHIIEHIPKPREIVKGDLVSCVREGDRTTGRVRGIDEGEAWVRFLDTGKHDVYPLRALTHTLPE